MTEIAQLISQSAIALAAGCLLGYSYSIIKSRNKEDAAEGTIDLIRGLMLFLVGLVLAFVTFSMPCNAQNVVRKGNTFTQIRVKSQPKDTFSITSYTYTTLDGVKHPVYVSKKGKYFIIRISKNGNKYRQYLKNVQKQLEEEKLCTKQQNQQKK